MVVNQKAVTGMGGLGKTQLAVQFAYCYGRFFRGVHWLNLADPSLLDSEIAQCGAQMGLANWPDEQPTQVILTLNKWKSDGPRLIVLDNFEALDQANNVLTRLRHSNLRLLLTSRRTDWTPASGLSSLPLELFSPEESLAFLNRSLEHRQVKDDDLKTLAERLGYLPLALELAARYLNGHSRLSVAEYLEQTKAAFNHASMREWRADQPAPTQHDLDLQRTFALSWNVLTSKNSKDTKKSKKAKSGRVVAPRIETIAQKIFLTAGYLAPNTPMPLEIFERALEISSDTCDEALSTLYGLGLLRNSEEDPPAIHPLLAEYARFGARKKEVLENLAHALYLLSSEALNTGLPARFLSILAHMPVTAAHAEEAGVQDAGRVWDNYGAHLRHVADYAGAKIICERAIKVLEATHGTEHPEVARAVTNLGIALRYLGDHTGAKAAYERAIKIMEANHRTEHPDFAAPVNNLGSVLRELGDHTGAKAAYERAIKIMEANHRTEHPTFATYVNNLGSVLLDLGDLAGARTMHERALRIRERAFGDEHPDVAMSLGWLGTVARDDGDRDNARNYFERALKMFQKFLPPNHPNIEKIREKLDSLGDV